MKCRSLICGGLFLGIFSISLVILPASSSASSFASPPFFEKGSVHKLAESYSLCVSVCEKKVRGRDRKKKKDLKSLYKLDVTLSKTTFYETREKDC